MSPTAVDPFADVERDGIPPVPQFLFDIARERYLLRPHTFERRQSPRCYVAAEALARPLAEDGSPAGDAFRCVITDLSRIGVRILHTRPIGITAPVLVVRVKLWEECVTADMKISRVVRWSRYLEYAGPFVTPIDFRGGER